MTEPALPPPKRTRAWLRYGMMALALAGVAFVLWRRRAELAGIPRLSGEDAAALVALNALTFVIVGLTHRALLRAFDIRLSAVEWLGLPFQVALYNLFLPAQGGVALRSIYLKKLHGFSVSDFILSMFYFGFAALAVLGATGVGATFLFLRAHAGAPIVAAWTGWGLGGFALIGGIGAAGMGAHLWADRLARRLRWTEGWAVSWRKMARARVVLTVLAVYAGVAWLYLLRIQVSLGAVGVTAAPADCALASVVLLGISIPSITPGNVGIREGALAFLMNALGYAPAQVLVATLIDRVIQTAVLIPGGLAANWILLGRLGGASNETPAAAQSPGP